MLPLLPRLSVVRTPVLARLSMGAAFLLGVSFAHATPFTYTETFTGSGRIGTTSYTNLAVGITVIADTTNVENDGGGFFENDSNNVTVTLGGSTYTLTNVSAAASNQQDGNASLAGLALFSTSILELGTTSSTFAGYDLTTAVGPVSGRRGGYVNTGGSFTTTSGTRISFTSIGSTTAFTAAPVMAAVPEPAPLLLLGTASVLGGILLRRRESVASHCPATSPALA